MSIPINFELNLDEDDFITLEAVARNAGYTGRSRTELLTNLLRGQAFKLLVRYKDSKEIEEEISEQ